MANFWLWNFCLLCTDSYMLATSLRTHCVCYQWTSCLSNCLSRGQIVGVRMETAFNLTATNSIYSSSIILTAQQVPSRKDALNSGKVTIVSKRCDTSFVICLVLALVPGSECWVLAVSRHPSSQFHSHSLSHPRLHPFRSKCASILWLRFKTPVIVGIERPSRVMETLRE